MLLPKYMGSRDGRIMVKGQPGQKVSKTLLRWLNRVKVMGTAQILPH
jgi:hypothetical protein